jgi:hypothetical protein
MCTSVAILITGLIDKIIRPALFFVRLLPQRHAALKNDAQRKARRQQLLDEHPNFWEQQEILSQYRTKRESCFIQLCLRRCGVFSTEAGETRGEARQGGRLRHRQIRNRSQ